MVEVLLLSLEVMDREVKAFGLEINWDKIKMQTTSEYLSTVTCWRLFWSVLTSAPRQRQVVPANRSSTRFLLADPSWSAWIKTNDSLKLSWILNYCTCQYFLTAARDGRQQKPWTKHSKTQHFRHVMPQENPLASLLAPCKQRHDQEQSNAMHHPLQYVVQKYRLYFFSHVVSIPDDKAHKQALWATVNMPLRDWIRPNGLPTTRPWRRISRIYGIFRPSYIMAEGPGQS